MFCLGKSQHSDQGINRDTGGATGNANALHLEKQSSNEETEKILSPHEIRELCLRSIYDMPRLGPKEAGKFEYEIVTKNDDSVKRLSMIYSTEPGKAKR